MEQLCYETLEKAGYTGYLLKNAPERVLQFGEGNFLRAFADYWFDMANEKAGWNGKCVLVQPIAQGLTQLINRQEGLYTLYLRGRQNGEKVDAKRVISSVSRCLNPYEKQDYDAMMDVAAGEALEYIVSNTTEAGIVYDPSCRLEDCPPASFPAKLTQVLLHRWRAGRPGVVVLSCGSAVETDWAQDCDALLYAGLGGEAVARSMLRALVGEITPGGKLAETWYRHYADAPVSHYYPGTEATSEYREGLYVGYRYTESADVAPAFAFGHGLSYTTFRYDNVQADNAGVSFDVTNTGDCAGDEVAQLYIHKPNAEVFRPAKELKGFQRVHLEKGETKRVTIPFDGYTFRYFNVRTNRFEVEGGEYELLIGASCRDIRLTAKHTEQGTNAPNPYAQLAVQSYRTARVTDVSDAEFAALLGHAIPPHLWDKTQPLTLNDTVTQLRYAKNPLARLIYRMLTRMKNKATAAGKPDLNLLFIYNIPFRGMAKMMNGMVSMAMAEDMLLMVNGHFFRGCGRLIHHFCHRPKLNLNPDKKKK